MHNRDSVWLPGSCRRNALSLSVLIFKAVNAEPEWYYHLMRPFVHYIPFTVNNTGNDLNSMLRWADENSYAASLISQQGHDFASFFFAFKWKRVLCSAVVVQVAQAWAWQLYPASLCSEYF